MTSRTGASPLFDGDYMAHAKKLGIKRAARNAEIRAKWKIKVESEAMAVVFEIAEGEAGAGMWDCPELLNRATVFIGGARDARFAGCKPFAAVVGPHGKGYAGN
jgi:hypothetical protein